MADFGPRINVPGLQMDLQKELLKLQKLLEKKKAFYETLTAINLKNEELFKKLDTYRTEFELLLIETHDKCEQAYATEYVVQIKAELDRMQALEPKTT